MASCGRESKCCWSKSSCLLLFGIILFATTLHVQGEVESDGPSEKECRPYIEKALKELETAEGEQSIKTDEITINEDATPSIEIATDDSGSVAGDNERADDDGGQPEQEIDFSKQADETEKAESIDSKEESIEPKNETDKSSTEDDKETNAEENTNDVDIDKKGDDKITEEKDSKEEVKEDTERKESLEDINDKAKSSKETETDAEENNQDKSQENNSKEKKTDQKESAESLETLTAENAESTETGNQSIEKTATSDDTKDEPEQDENNVEITEAEQNPVNSNPENTKETEEKNNKIIEDNINFEKVPELTKEDKKDDNQHTNPKTVETNTLENSDKASDKKPQEEPEITKRAITDDQQKVEKSEEDEESAPEEELIDSIEIPENLRARDHVDQLLKLDDRNTEIENVINRISEITLRDLKKLYENAIKPLETLYKYRDLSNRHFGDPEIFSKPLVLFMGPWSGGKSSIINYLTDNEYNSTSLRTGAEPSPAYFNILMYGDQPEILDGTQLAADFTLAGLQKFGQGLEERLRGLKLPSKILKKVNIVEIPGILEVRKQISRVFPFNDACQWFIDRADIIFLVYDPSKLDVGPETEAILDQLKGRESQTRIVLNKADQVKPEELMRVQGALIWNISPLMSSAQPPLMYTTSLWSKPFEPWAPVRLLQAQERAFLRDLRSAVDKRIENKIVSARRFAVRVRNHAKMVDCYLTTYYNHKSVFGNRKQISDQIVEHPQDYHIYEGLSTLTNISRYDLPDPDIYKGFFGLNPLYNFQQLSATCTYFRGCPINRLDVAIAYDLPEMLGKHKKLIDAALGQLKVEKTDS